MKVLIPYTLFNAYFKNHFDFIIFFMVVENFKSFFVIAIFFKTFSLKISLFYFFEFEKSFFTGKDLTRIVFLNIKWSAARLPDGRCLYAAPCGIRAK